MNQNGTRSRGNNGFEITEADLLAATTEQRAAFDAARNAKRAIASARAAQERRWKDKTPEQLRQELSRHEQAAREIRALL